MKQNNFSAQAGFVNRAINYFKQPCMHFIRSWSYLIPITSHCKSLQFYLLRTVYLIIDMGSFGRKSKTTSFLHVPEHLQR